MDALGSGEQFERTRAVAVDLPQPGHRHELAVPVLRQAGGIAELVADRQVPPSRVEVVSLVEHLGHADVHVRGSPEHGRGVFGGGSQSSLVVAHRVAEAALRDTEVRQRDRTIDLARAAPCPAQRRHAVGVPAVRRLEVSGPPVREPDQGLCRPAAEVVVGTSEVERSLRVRHEPVRDADRCSWGASRPC